MDVRTALLDTEADTPADLDTQPVFSDFQESAQQPRDADFDFSSPEDPTDIGDSDSLESGSADTFAQQETVVTTPATPVSETVMGLATEAGDTGVMPINEKTLQSREGLENSFDEFETELKSFFPDQEGSATTVTHEPFSHLQSSEVEERDTEQNLNLAQSTNSSQQEPDDQVEEENSLINSPADEQTLDNDIDRKLVLNCKQKVWLQKHISLTPWQTMMTLSTGLYRQP